MTDHVDTAQRASTVSLTGTGAAVRIEGLRKTVGSVAAVDHINRDIQAGECFKLIGQSGGGRRRRLRQ